MKYFLIFFIIVLFNFSFGHEGEKHKNKSKKVHVDTLQLNVYAYSDSLSQEFHVVIPDMIFEHLHNKIVHFPIALSVVAFFFSLLDLNKKRFDLTIKIIVGLSFVSSLAAIVSGVFQISAFETSSDLIYVHRNFGIISSILLLFWLISLFINSLKRFSLLPGLMVSIIILITAFYGGIISLYF